MRCLVVVLLILGCGSVMAQAPAPAPVPADTPPAAPAAEPAAPETSEAKVARLVAEGDALYRERFRLTTWREALARYQEAERLDQKNFEVLWRLARQYFFLAERASDDDSKKDLGMRGYEWGQKAIAASPLRIEGHYFSGIALGQYALGISVVKALVKGIDGDYTRAIGAALKIDRSYDQGGPLIAMGRYYYNLPWPKYDGEKSIQFLKEAIQKGDKLRAHFYLAETYLEEEQYADALREVEVVLSRKLSPGQGDYADDLWFQQQAPALKKKIQEEMD
ncbi:MAG: hypothetical protein GYA21_13490 [Myxococcales bacterium]|nr:hypothetical protein [Myxococcales bacterium]